MSWGWKFKVAEVWDAGGRLGHDKRGSNQYLPISEVIVNGAEQRLYPHCSS